MSRRTRLRHSDDENRRWEILLLISSLIALLSFIAAAYREVAMAPWRGYQRDYRAALVEHAKDERTRRAAETFEVRYYQAFLPALGRIDRCMTCHIGIENPAMKDAPQPLTFHPGEVLAHHPPDRFGCTICHGGQGRATEMREAHGEESHRPVPMWRGEMLEVSCAQCHADPELPGFPVYNLARRLFTKNACQACHALRGVGPMLPSLIALHGPDLTLAANQHNFEWHVSHFLNPAEIVPGSKMPNFGFSENEAQALAFLMMSFKGKNGSRGYLATHTPGGAADAQLALTPEQLGVLIDPNAAPDYVGSETCLKCHSALHPGLKDIWQNSKMGHDAFLAVSDEPENQACFPCHATGYNPQTNVFAERNVGCEACHGPGKEYVTYVLSGRLDDHKVRAMENVLQADSCLTCHRAMHVTKEQHAEVMRSLAETWLEEPATGPRPPGIPGLAAGSPVTIGLQDPHHSFVSVPAAGGETVAPPATPNEFGVVVDPRAAPGHIGTDSCLFCHETLHPNVAHHWRSSKKARAFEAVRDVPDQATCFPCHTTGHNPGTNVFVERNVGCEACHGPGKDYTADVMEGRRDRHGPRASVWRQNTNSCVRCHRVHVAREKHVETILHGRKRVPWGLAD